MPMLRLSWPVAQQDAVIAEIEAVVARANAAAPEGTYRAKYVLAHDMSDLAPMIAAREPTRLKAAS